jgi:cobalt-zinc-cadmium resistance protein CzcA
VIEWLVQTAARKRVIVLCSVALAAAIAAYASRSVKLDALPDITSNQVLVLTSAPGFSPDEVERRVTTPIELALAGAPGSVERRSISRFGISSVTAVFADQVPAQNARQAVLERLASVRSRLPEGASEPELGPLTGGLGEIFHFTLRSPGRTAIELRELAELRVAPMLRKVPGVVEVNSWGGERRALQVDVDMGRLARHKLMLRDLAFELARGIGVAAGGAVPRGDGRQVLLRGVARPVMPADLSGLRIHVQEGASVPLSDLARVRSRGLPRLGAATQNGSGEVLYLMAQMLRDTNALDVTRRIHELMPELRRALPSDVALEVVYDRSALVRATLGTVGKNLLEGGLLVIVVLFATLGSVRAGLIVASVIPLSMLCASVGMALTGVAGNLMSLGALDFGLLVDGAVVMVEHLFHEQLHDPPPPGEARVAWLARRAAYVARPTMFAVLTILLVYVPVLSLSGVDGKMFRPMALVVVMALCGALLLSLTYVPAAAALWLRPADVPRRPPPFVRLAERLHLPVLEAASANPLVPALIAGSMLALTAVGFWKAGSELAPQLDEGDLVVQTVRAADISFERAVHDATALERAARGVPEVERVVSRVGNPSVATDIMGLEQADVFVKLKPQAAWRPGVTREALIGAIDRAIHQVDPEVELAFTQPIQMRFNELLGGSVTDVSVSIFGDDLDELQRLAHVIAGAVGQVPGARDVRVLAPAAVPVLNVEPNYAAAAALDITPRDLLDGIEAMRAGMHVATTYDGLLAVPVVLRVPGAESPAAVSGFMLSNPSGGLIPLAAIAKIEERKTPSMVQHLDGQRRLMVGFNVRGADLGTVAALAQAGVEHAVKLPSGYRLEWGGQVQSLGAAARRLMLVLPAVLVLMIALMLLVFRELRPVLLLLLHIPFACAGGIAMLFLRSMPLSISAAVGFIALSGIAVMNGMVLLVELQRHERAQLAPREAALRAARNRARPVIMTALVAALGFLPMMLATGVGAEVQRPLASVVVGGLFTSTATTLVIMPALYPWLRRVMSRASRTGPPPARSGTSGSVQPAERVQSA